MRLSCVAVQALSLPARSISPWRTEPYRTSAANAGWVFWQAAQASLQQQHAALAGFVNHDEYHKLPGNVYKLKA